VQIGLDHLFQRHDLGAYARHGQTRRGADSILPAASLAATRRSGATSATIFELDIRGARAAGLHTVWMNRTSVTWPGVRCTGYGLRPRGIRALARRTLSRFAQGFEIRVSAALQKSSRRCREVANA
jgi:hypothetical protein